MSYLIQYERNMKSQNGNHDPCPNKKDTVYWETILCLCGTMQIYKEIYHTLHQLRQRGGELVPTKESLRIVRGAMPEAEWEEQRIKYLEPRRDLIAEVLQTAREMAPKKGDARL